MFPNPHSWENIYPWISGRRRGIGPGRAQGPGQRETQTIHSPTVAWTGCDWRPVVLGSHKQITDHKYRHQPARRASQTQQTVVTPVSDRMTGIRMLRKLMVTLLISMSVAKQVSVKTQGDSSQHHPNSVYSQMHQKHSRKSADMKIFYQTGVRATIHKRSICIFISPSRTINGSSNYHSVTFSSACCRRVRI